MNDELYNMINNLLSGLRSSKAVRLVDDYYQIFDNSAPAILMQGDMDKLQNELDKFRNMK